MKSLTLFLIVLPLIHCMGFAEIKVYKNGGLKACINADEGTKKFEFHANVNKKIKMNEQGQISDVVVGGEGNTWCYVTRSPKIPSGSFIAYWVSVIDKKGERRRIHVQRVKNDTLYDDAGADDKYMEYIRGDGYSSVSPESLEEVEEENYTELTETTDYDGKKILKTVPKKRFASCKKYQLAMQKILETLYDFDVSINTNTE